MPITPHANGEPFLSGSSHIHFKFVTILLVVWSANGKRCGSALTSNTSSNLLKLMMTLTDAFMRVIVLSIQTNRARCALCKKILDLLNEESVFGESSGRASLYEKSYCECLKR